MDSLNRIVNVRLGAAVDYTSHAALGSSKNGITFRALTGIRGLYSYVVGLVCRVETAVDESSASAALAWETLVNWIASTTITAAGHTYCSAVSGKAFYNIAAMSGIIAPGGKGAGFWPIADVGSSEAAVAQDFGMLIPFAPGFFRSNDSGMSDLAGAVPLPILADQGAMQYTTISALGGNWRLDGGTDTHEIGVYPVIVDLKNPISYVRPTFHELAAASGDGSVTLPGSGPRTIVCAGIYDDAYSTMTEAPGLELNVDGLVYQSGVTSDELNKLYAARGSENYIGQDGGPMDNVPICGSWGNSPGASLTGSVIKIQNGHTAHTASLYVSMDLRQPTVAEMLADLKAQAVPADLAGRVVAEYERVAAAAGDTTYLRAGLVPYRQAVPGGVAQVPGQLGATPLVVAIEQA